MGEATSRGGRAAWVSLGLSSARLEWGDGDGGGRTGVNADRDLSQPRNPENSALLLRPLPRTQRTPREGMAPQRKEGRLGPAVLGEDPVPALPTIFLQILFFHSPSRPSLPHSWQLPRRKGKGSQGGLQFPLVLVWSCLPLRHRGSVSLALEHRHPNLQPNSDSVRSVPNGEGAGSRPELVRASPRRDQRCAGSRAAAEPLDFRAQKAERRRFPSSGISGQGRPWKFPWPFLPTGDFYTCPRRRNKVVAGAGGRSRFPKSPFTSLISVTRPRSTSRSS